MKKFSLLILLSVAVSFVACDNEIASSQVPSIVKNTFMNHFPQARDTEWEIQDEDYEVSFEIDNVDYDALLDSSGNLLKYKYEIARIALPESIKSFLEKNYPQEKWENAEHIIEGNIEYFQLELDDFFKDKKLVVDSSAKELSTKYWN